LEQVVAARELGGIQTIQQTFIGFQQYLYLPVSQSY